MKRLEEIKRRTIEELRPHLVPWKPIFTNDQSGEAPLFDGIDGIEGTDPGKRQRKCWIRDKDGKRGKGRKMKKDPFGLRDDETQLLERAVRREEESIEERCAALSMDRNREWRARKRLMEKGYLEEAGKIGGKEQYFQVLEKGEQWAKERGIPVPREKSKATHRILRKKTRQAVGSTDSRIKFKRCSPINGVQPDDFALIPGGERMAIQVSVKNHPRDEARALLKLAEDPSLDWVLMVAVSKAKALQIKNALLREAEKRGEFTRELLKKIMLEDALEVMKGNFKWRSLA